MFYNSINFLIIFPLIFFGYYIIPNKYQIARRFFLLIVSYLLYLNYNPAYSLFLVGVTIVTFFSAKLIEGNKNRSKYLITGVIIALLPLIYFKYFNTINENSFEFLSFVGLRFHFRGLNWVVPIGISFFTFQSLGYLFDVYKNKIKAENDFLSYALFLSFFPSIVAGPINKASLLLPQIKALRPYFDYTKAVEGARLLLWGMFMKVVIADHSGLYVDLILDNYDCCNGTECLVASLLFSLQIYADFAGYSLMAIGVGKILGFELTENFRRPYFAIGLSDFWKRWHISLSTWLKDYVYIPLGGSRISQFVTYRNLLITFVISGLWHGDHWNFLFWGLLHGIGLIIERMTKVDFLKLHYLKIPLTFVFVNIAWIFFRMSSVEDSLKVIEQIFTSFSFEIQPVSLTILLSASFLFLNDVRDEFFPGRFQFYSNKKRIIRWSAYLVTIIAILLEGVLGQDNFIYANF